MNVIDAVKTRRVCFRTAEPTVVADFRNPAASVSLVVAQLVAEDWEVDEERTRLRAEVEKAQVVVAGLRQERNDLKAQVDDLQKKLDAAGVKP